MYVCVEVLMFLGVRLHLYMGCVAARVCGGLSTRYERRVHSVVVVLGYIVPGISTVQLSPVQKKTR